METIISIIAGVIAIFSSLYFPWRQNKIFERQNEIFAAQGKSTSKGGKQMPPASKFTIGKKYWPMLVMSAITLSMWAAVGLYLYLRHNNQSSVQPTPVESIAPFMQPPAAWLDLETVTGKSYWGEKVILDGKRFVDCKFTNVKFIYNGTGAWSFEDCAVEPPVIVTTENYALSSYGDIQSYFNKMITAAGGHSSSGDFDSNGNPMPSPGSWGNITTAPSDMP